MMKLVVIVGTMALLMACATEEECTYSISDFGRIPRLAAEKASGLVGTTAKTRALENNSAAWHTYEKVYEEKLAKMQQECGISQ